MHIFNVNTNTDTTKIVNIDATVAILKMKDVLLKLKNDSFWILNISVTNFFLRKILFREQSVTTFIFMVTSLHKVYRVHNVGLLAEVINRSSALWIRHTESFCIYLAPPPFFFIAYAATSVTFFCIYILAAARM